MRVHEDPLHWVAVAWAALAGGLFLVRGTTAGNAKAAAPEGARTCIVAVASHVQHAVTPDGAARVTTFRERIYRCGDSVWSERLRAPEYFVPAEPPPGDVVFPARELARFVTRTTDGGATLLLVSRVRRLVIEVAPEDFPRVGFEGSWDSAAHLLAKGNLVPVPPPESSPSGHGGDGCRWLGSNGDGGWARALFCDTVDVPLEIHFGGAPDGATEDVAVQVLPLSAESVPWQGLGDLHWSPSSEFPG